MHPYHAIVLAFLFGILTTPSQAQEPRPSSTYLGMIGLNTIPSARMEEEGTLRGDVSTLDPYTHMSLGYQIAAPLGLTFRQSMSAFKPGEKPEHVFPALDLKVRLMSESETRPEVAFGVTGLMGHRRFSSEYFALTKRVYSVDLTTGIAWGQMASEKGAIKNPFRRFSSHFEEDRKFSSESASTPEDWFTGKTIGFFAGLEYVTPVNGLSLKADYNAQNQTAEKEMDPSFEKWSPWSVGFNYAPTPWLDFGGALVGVDKLMFRLSLKQNIKKWPIAGYQSASLPSLPSPRAERTDHNSAKATAAREGLVLEDVMVNEEKSNLSAVLSLRDDRPSPLQMGRAWRILSAFAGQDIESLTLYPMRAGLKGRGITISRNDIERSARAQGSPEEIWSDTSFIETKSWESPLFTKTSPPPMRKVPWLSDWRLIPDLAFGLSEEETSHTYRASFLAEKKNNLGYGFISGNSLRLNIADNLESIEEYRHFGPKTVRADADLYTRNLLTVDRSFLSWIKTFKTDLHVGLNAGYLEEMFAGYGAEILYRPFDKTFAIGGEIWQVYKRDGESLMGMAPASPDSTITGHLNLYYEIPQTDVTAFAKVGRYLAGDWGVSGGFEKKMAQGIKIRGLASVTENPDHDAYGGTRNLYAGLEMTLPLGGLPYLPDGSSVRLSTAPVGRDSAQILDAPLPLYDLTEPMSYRHIGQNWQEVLK